MDHFASTAGGFVGKDRDAEDAKRALLAEGVKILVGKAAEQAAREEAWRAASVANLERLRVAEEKAVEPKAEQEVLLAAYEAKRAFRAAGVQFPDVKAAKQYEREYALLAAAVANLELLRTRELGKPPQPYSTRPANPAATVPHR